MKRAKRCEEFAGKERALCRVQLDRLVVGGAGRDGSKMPEIAGFEVIQDFRPYPQGKVAAYGRVRKFRKVGSFSQNVLQYLPLLPWVEPWRFTLIADDQEGVTPEEIEAIIVHCSKHKITLVELALDFSEDSGVDRKFVMRHGVFGKSRRQPDPAGQGNLRYGTRKSPKLVRCYSKQQTKRYRVELESHGLLLRRYSVSQASHLASFASRLYPDQIKFVSFRWNVLRRYLIRRFGPAGPRIYEEVERCAAHSLRAATRFLTRRGVSNAHRFLKPLRINDDIQRALRTWATQFSSLGSKPT